MRTGWKGRFRLLRDILRMRDGRPPDQRKSDARGNTIDALTPRCGGKLGIRAGATTLRPAPKPSGYSAKLLGNAPSQSNALGKDVLYPLCETRCVHNPANRTVLFIFNESGSRIPRVLGFPDHREEKNP